MLRCRPALRGVKKLELIFEERKISLSDMEKKSFKELNDDYKMKKKANEMQKIYSSVSPDQAKKLATLDLTPEKLLQLYNIVNDDDEKFEQELSKQVRSKQLRKKLLEWIHENKLRA